jgi:hypothetical protein
MQPTKDSFYIALRDRLAAANPSRVITVNGTTRPAIVVAENEVVIPVRPLPDAFYIEWGAVQAISQASGQRAMLSLECVISYHTFGTAESGVDRGRALATLDTDLLSITQPGCTAKIDYASSPPAELGTSIVWSAPQLGKVAGSEAPRNDALPRGTGGVRLERAASLKIFFFPEVN